VPWIPRHGRYGCREEQRQQQKQQQVLVNLPAFFEPALVLRRLLQMQLVS
jgi:hypothetical protein